MVDCVTIFTIVKLHIEPADPTQLMMIEVRVPCHNKSLKGTRLMYVGCLRGKSVLTGQVMSGIDLENGV